MDRNKNLHESNEINSRNKVYLNFKLDNVEKSTQSFENT